MAFRIPPTIFSPPFKLDLTFESSINGPMGLDEANPVNQEYLHFEAQIIQFIRDYEKSDNPDIQHAVAFMKKAFETLQEFRKDHWERGRRRVEFESCQQPLFQLYKSNYLSTKACSSR